MLIINHHQTLTLTNHHEALTNHRPPLTGMGLASPSMLPSCRCSLSVPPPAYAAWPSAGPAEAPSGSGAPLISDGH